MSQNYPTLKTLFTQAEQQTGDGKGRLFDRDRLRAGAKPELEKQTKIIKWEAVEGLMEKKILEALDIPFQDVLLSAWKKYDEVRDAAESGSGEPVLVEHTIESKHKPKLQFVFKGVRVAEIEFTVLLQLVLEGFRLKIRDHAIKSVEAGQITGKGSISVESEEIASANFGSIKLPLTMDLGEGIRV